MYQHIKGFNERSASLLLLLLLSADFVFNALHIYKHSFVPNSSLWNVRISAYLDIYHLIKLFWIIILFSYLLKSTRCLGYFSWILIFTCLLIDDALLLHQNIGDRIALSFEAYFPHTLSLQPRFFELAVLAIAGIILLTVLAWAYFSSPYPFRKVSNDIFLFIVGLVFFGLIVDVATAIKLVPSIMIGLEIVEDAGEMVIYSLILWYVFLITTRNGKLDLFLHELLYKPRT